MSKKALTSMKDENQDLQKQIGCISGFFQLFDRHRFLSSRSQHNIPTQGGTSNNIKELNNTTKKAKAKNVKVAIARENQQFSTESSGASMSSSSCSSSMSSLEFNRTIQLEPPSISQMKIPENSNSEAAMKQLGTPRPQSLDFHDIVKDSLHIDAQRLSVTTVAKEEKKGKILKRIDSPRPLQAAKSVNAAWDSPRLSYDGRDTLKSATKHKEIPRLSLDSKEGSIKSFNEGTKSRNLLKGPQKVYEGSTTMLKQLQETDTSKRPSSVVAKLMGLEALPDWTQTCDNYNINKTETIAGSSMNDEYMQKQSSASPSDASITNVRPYSQFSVEPTPWRQPDASQGSQLQASKRSESSTKASNRSLSVYGEIEKRMADLEFKESGKDLRALKQILEAMQRYKESLDTTRDQASNSSSDNRSNSSLSESLNVQSPRTRQKDPKSTTLERSNSTQGSKSPIVIMKPAKVARKTNHSASTEMPIQGKSGISKFYRGDPTNGMLVDKLDRKTAKGSPAIKHVKDPISQPQKMRTLKLMQCSKVPQVINGENSANASNIAETRSPRLQKKFGLERRSPPTSPSSDSSSNRRQQNRQKFSTLEERNESFSKMSYQRKDFKQEVDAVLPDFGGKRNMDSHIDIEVMHTDHTEMIIRNSIQLEGLNENNVEKELSKESFMAETIVTAEQPSPVSVLDAAFYREDPPSPVKRKSDISKDLDEILNTCDSSEDKSEDLPLSSNSKVNFSNGTSDIDLKTQNLVQILQQIDYSDQRFTNFSDHKDPDHKYISEILLASGLLASPSSSQALHSSGYPVNPMLFFALEQIKTDKMYFNIEHSVKRISKMNNHEQMQRKLIFDVVNEILVQKLVSENSFQPYQQPEGRKLKGEQLLDSLCNEIDDLQHKSRNVSLANEDENLTSLLREDLMHHPTVCTECYNEIPNVALDIERLIFKDLITDVVRGEVANHSGKYSRKMQLPSRNSS